MVWEGFHDNQKDNKKASYCRAQLKFKKRINVKIIGFQLLIRIPAGPLTAHRAP